MRTSILLLSLIFSLSVHAQIPFAQLGSSWTYTQGSCCGPDSNVAVFQALTDTVIGGRTCSKITTNTAWIGCYEFVQYLTVSNDSMFYLSEDGSQFQLLFRWNAVSGDTWSTPIGQGTFTDTLDWTDLDTGHVVLDGVALRTLSVGQSSRQSTLFCPIGGTVTERLGGNTPFTWVFAACDGETYTGFRCYEDPDISWLNPQYPQCALSTGIAENKGAGAMSISPTILERGGTMRVTMDRSMVGHSTLEMRDVSGRLLATKPVTGPSMTLTVAYSGLILIALRKDGELRSSSRIVVR